VSSFLHLDPRVLARIMPRTGDQYHQLTTKFLAPSKK